MQQFDSKKDTFLHSEKQGNGARQYRVYHVGNWPRHYGFHISPYKMLPGIFKQLEVPKNLDLIKRKISSRILVTERMYDCMRQSPTRLTRNSYQSQQRHLREETAWTLETQIIPQEMLPRKVGRERGKKTKTKEAETIHHHKTQDTSPGKTRHKLEPDSLIHFPLGSVETHAKAILKNAWVYTTVKENTLPSILMN